MRRSLNLFAVAALALAAPLSTAWAEISPVKVKVEAKTSSDRGEKGASSQSRTLNVTVSSSAKEALDLKVKYRIFARDVASKNLVSAGEGEIPVSVKPGATEKVETPSASASQKDGKADKNKRAEPEGTKLIGQGVQVLQGDKVVAEYYEPASIKEEFTKVGPKPAAK